jgi:hypothetical protein
MDTYARFVVIEEVTYAIEQVGLAKADLTAH